jgi:hypothetical protein
MDIYYVWALSSPKQLSLYFRIFSQFKSLWNKFRFVVSDYGSQGFKMSMGWCRNCSILIHCILSDEPVQHYNSLPWAWRSQRYVTFTCTYSHRLHMTCCTWDPYFSSYRDMTVTLTLQIKLIKNKFLLLKIAKTIS